MQNKKPCVHGMSKQQASVSWPFPCAIHKSILLSINKLVQLQQSLKDLKQFFPFCIACCKSPVDMTQGCPCSALLSQCCRVTHLLGPFALSWIYLLPPLVCFLVLLSTTCLCTYRTSHFSFLLVLILHLFSTLTFTERDNASYDRSELLTFSDR